MISKIEILLAQQKSFVAIYEVICQFSSVFSQNTVVNNCFVRSVLNTGTRTSSFDHSGRGRGEGGLGDSRFT